jgi:hypothetical protein
VDIHRIWANIRALLEVLVRLLLLEVMVKLLEDMTKLEVMAKARTLEANRVGVVRNLEEGNKVVEEDNNSILLKSTKF